MAIHPVVLRQRSEKREMKRSQYNNNNNMSSKQASSCTDFWPGMNMEHEGEAIPPVPDIYDRSQEHKLPNRSAAARNISKRKGEGG